MGPLRRFSYAHPPIHLSTCLQICSFPFLSIRPFACLFVCLSMQCSICGSVNLFVYFCFCFDCLSFATGCAIQRLMFFGYTILSSTFILSNADSDICLDKLYKGIGHLFIVISLVEWVIQCLREFVCPF